MALAGLVFVDGDRREVVELRVEAIAEERIGRSRGTVISSAGYSAKNILHLLEERLVAPSSDSLGFERLLRHRLRQLLEQVLLFLGQLLRDRDAR